MEGVPEPPGGFATTRLDLRRILHSDLDHFAELIAVPAVAQRLVPGGPSLRWVCDQLAAFERHWELYGFGQSAVIERATGDFVGRLGLQVRVPWDDVELTFLIAKDRQRRGYATEAGRVWVHWARANGFAERLVVVVPPRDEAALRTARALGFRPDPGAATAWSGDRIVHRLAPLAEPALC